MQSYTHTHTHTRTHTRTHTNTHTHTRTHTNTHTHTRTHTPTQELSAAQALVAEFATLPPTVAYYAQRFCLMACLERADEGERFIGRLNQLLGRDDERSDENIELLCALLGSAAGSKLVLDGGDPLAAVWRFAKELYVLRAELRLGPSPALAWAWTGPPPSRARRRRSTTACSRC